MEVFPRDITLYNIVFDVLALLGIAAAALYYFFISQITVGTRKAQLFMQLYSRFHDQDFMRRNIDIMNLEWEGFEDYWKKYGMVTNPQATSEHYSVGNFYEGIGLMVKRKLIDLEMVNDLMGGLVTRYWEKMGPVIEKQRELFNWPGAYEWTEYLYKQIQSYPPKSMSPK